MTPEGFQEFIKKSGLKKKFIADYVLHIPQWVLTKWTRHETMLFPLQQKKLDEFCNNFNIGNTYMKSKELQG